jgi:hypothetical protein
MGDNWKEAGARPRARPVHPRLAPSPDPAKDSRRAEGRSLGWLRPLRCASGPKGASPTADKRRRKGARGKEIAHRYTDQERERALVAVALASGNCERAATSLAEQDIPVPARTLREWKREHADLYQRVEQDVLPRCSVNSRLSITI